MANPKNLDKPLCITPSWPAPSCIKAYTTTRHNGYSLAPYDSFNLGEHVGDRAENVAQNRKKLFNTLGLPQQPIWLNQVHGKKSIELTTGFSGKTPTADASFTQHPDVVCAVLTADCLPLLLCNTHGTEVAAIHGGWRGLLSGIIDSTLEQLQSPKETLMAWLGPAIGPQAFEINEAIREQFITSDPEFKPAFEKQNGQWHGNLYELAKIRLKQCGVHNISGGEYCTVSHSEDFFSYRKAAQNQTGRMATLIWIASK